MAIVLPRDVDDLIAAMKRLGWPEPEVRSAYFRVDETGPMAFSLGWPQASAEYWTGRGWVGVYGIGGICPAPFSWGAIDSAEIPKHLLYFGRET